MRPAHQDHLLVHTVVWQQSASGFGGHLHSTLSILQTCFKSVLSHSHPATHPEFKADADPFGDQEEPTEVQRDRAEARGPLQLAVGFRQAQEYHAYRVFREDA